MFLAQCASISNLIIESYVLEIHPGKMKVLDGSHGEQKNKMLDAMPSLESGWFAKFKAACGIQVPQVGTQGGGVRPVPLLVTITIPVIGVNFAGRVAPFPLVNINAALMSLEADA